jgi:ribosomal protein S17
VVKSTKMTRTIVVRRDYLHYIKKYARCVLCVAAEERGQAAPSAQARVPECCRACMLAGRGTPSQQQEQPCCTGMLHHKVLAQLHTCTDTDTSHTSAPHRRYEKRHTNISAHISPAFRCREGDTVVIGQCRCEGAAVESQRACVWVGGGALGGERCRTVGWLRVLWT